MIIRHDVNDEAYLALGKQYGNPVCSNIGTGLGTGTLIHPQWVLTAGHVAQHIEIETHPVSFSGQDYSINRTIFHPVWRGFRSLGALRHLIPFRHVVDLALLRLTQPVTHVNPVPLYEEKDERAKTAIFAGRGDFGTGITGPTKDDGQMRGATNKIDAVKGKWIIFCFDAPPHTTSLEGISGPGDSGGPAFIEIGSTVYLAGVSSWQDWDMQGQEGLYDVLEYYARVSSYVPWIRETIVSGAPQ